jgi:hypothetical protein
LWKNINGRKQEKLPKRHYSSAVCAFSAIFLRVAEKSHFRAFSRIRPISDEISADNFVLVVNAREYKTHEQQPKNPRR